MKAYLIDYQDRDLQDYVFAETKESAEKKFLEGKSAFAFGSKLKHPDENDTHIERCRKINY